jgi:DsbC/DsbD-like thiol-disulfide interchange protein
MLCPNSVSGNLPIDVKMVNAARRIRLVLTNESCLLICKYSWILGQSALNFMIGSNSDRSAFKEQSSELRKTISISVHHDNPRSFAQIEISVLDRRSAKLCQNKNKRPRSTQGAYFRSHTRSVNQRANISQGLPVDVPYYRLYFLHA